MKKLTRNLLFLLLVILLLPSFVMAEKVESKIASDKEIIPEFVLDRIIIRNVGITKYANYQASGKEAVVFDAKIYNDYIKKVDVLMELHLYDSKRNTIDIIKTVVPVSSKANEDYSKVLFQNNTTYDIKRIAYYSLVAELNEDMTIYNDTEDDNYYYQNYKLNIKVNENNVYNVKENFDVKFNKYVTTIRVGIPFRLRYTSPEGKKYNKRAVMSNIKTSLENELETEEGIRNIYIGEEERVADTRSYEVNYDYNVGEDKIPKKDEFVFYLINNRDCKIDGVSFEIEFPKVLEDSKVSFMDQHGTILESFKYKIVDNKIIGSYEGMINASVSYAIKVELPDGYFKHASKNISDLTIISLFLTVLTIAISVIVLMAQRKRDRDVKYNSIYFNDKLNSLEVGYLYSGYVRDRDISTLLIGLANKGYIKVDKSRKNYKIIKVKDYDSDDRLEKVFMTELFLSGNSITRKDLISNVDYMKKNMEAKIQEHQKKNRLTLLPIFNYKLIFWVLMVLIFIANTANIFFEYQPSALFVNCLFGSLGFVILFYGILHEKVKIEKMLYIFVGLMFIISPIVLNKYQAFMEDPLKLITYIVGIISMMVIVNIVNMMSNRSFYGTKMYNKINAYKNYLSSFEDIDKELDKNDECFYQVLPYTFVLGISDKWYAKFKNRKIKKVSWYINDDFTLSQFYDDIKDIYSDIYISLKNYDK